MRGLLLNNEYGMYHAAITKKKTNTRRCHKSLTEINKNPDQFKFIGFSDERGSLRTRFQMKKHGQILTAAARYKVGDIVCIQEPTMNLKGFTTDEDMIMYQYKDHNGHTETEAFGMLIEDAIKKGAKWENKMFMESKLARYFVKITRVEMERLEDISGSDCLAEGLEIFNSGQSRLYGYRVTSKNNITKSVMYDTPKKAYFSLYNAINSDKSGPENPWLFSYHFELCNKPDHAG